MAFSRPIKALIFDFDGLIIDTESPGFQAWSETYEAHGCQLLFERYSSSIGTFGDELHRQLEEQVGRRLDWKEIEARCSARWTELVELQPLLPGIVPLVEAAKARGLKLAIASSSTEEWVTRHLRRFALSEQFDAICTRDYVDAPKPDPALYRLALDRLGVAPHEAIAFEDSPHGIQAAKRAGIFCVAIPNPLTGRLPLDHADLRLSSLGEFDLNHV